MNLRFGEISIGNGTVGSTTINCWYPKSEKDDTRRNHFCSLSRNEVAYRVSMPYGFHAPSMTIFRDTKEGIKLDKLVEEWKSLPLNTNKVGTDNKINNFLIKTFLANVSTAFIVNLLDITYKEGVEDGKEIKANEIKKVLNIEP